MLFPTVQPLNVLLVVCFELLAFQFECVSDQASLWSPGFSTQPNFLGDLKSLQFCLREKKKQKQKSQVRMSDMSVTLVQNLA